MCGIIGFIDLKHSSTRDNLNSMLQVLSHRGPDGEGLVFEENETFQIGLAHKRLSIIDLSVSANQPFSHDSLTIVFNGEIYNFREIRTELEALNHKFLTNSDTEVILHSYLEWGVGAIHKFIGMFAFVIYDSVRKTLKIFRDRAGVKPLYYYWKDDLFLFSSELKSFHAHPSFKKEINFSALSLFLKYCYIPAPYSIFENTYKLLPGHYLDFDLSNSSFTLNQYWDVNECYEKEKLKLDDHEAILETERVLKKAFDYRMVADVPVGVFLSGGYDSSAVVALLQKDRSEKLKTFTIGFQEERFNEAPFAKEVAQYLGTDHTEYYCTIAEAKEILPTLPYYYDEPFGDSSAIPTMLVSKVARKSVTVSLSADGGDEIFGGYNRYPIIENLDRTFGNLPNISRKLVYQVSGIINPERVPILKDKKLIGQRYAKFRKLIREANSTNYLKNMCSILDDDSIDRLMMMSHQDLKTNFDEQTEKIEALLDRVLAKDYKTYMVDDILVKVDRATMSVGLEGREPFLDQNVIDWAARLPGHLKIRNGNKKYILKEIVHQYIPKSMMDRPKAGFAIPIEDWFQIELAEYFELYLNKNYVEAQGVFNFNEISKWVTLYKLGRKEYITQIWNVLMFQLWYEKWMK